jgi:hypothetical protein
LILPCFSITVKIKHSYSFKHLMFNWISHAGLDITILGSNKFYSYRNQVFLPFLIYQYLSVMMVQLLFFSIILNFYLFLVKFPLKSSSSLYMLLYTVYHSCFGSCEKYIQQLTTIKESQLP